MKHDTFDKYPADSMELPEQALLTTWDCLPDFRDDLVLVGGLAVRYLTQAPTGGLPGPVTLDVDFGVSMGADGGAYPGIRENLSSHGFKWEKGRFSRKFQGMELFIDLMTDDGKSDKGTAVIDEGLSVNIFPGINRALACHRTVTISGKTLLGVPQQQKIRVAEIGPMLVLKLNAFGGPSGRKAPKDAHDILYLAMNYLDGPAAAVAGFQEERRIGNRGLDYAMLSLRDFFSNPDAQGPTACAAFRLNNQHDEPQNEQASLRIRQQFVTLAQALLA
ncbi:MAG: hypothetical protein JWM99_1284 [Verrucomicrobiales bacterium]|nr:hypothetical protein [Verrucomicrobiales bacterium]